MLIVLLLLLALFRLSRLFVVVDCWANSSSTWAIHSSLVTRRDVQILPEARSARPSIRSPCEPVWPRLSSHQGADGRRRFGVFHVEQQFGKWSCAGTASRARQIDCRSGYMARATCEARMCGLYSQCNGTAPPSRSSLDSLLRRVVQLGSFISMSTIDCIFWSAQCRA